MGTIDKTSLTEDIIKHIQEIHEQQNNGAKLPQISDETVLLETGLDSLGFAILVTKLEETLDYDPFSLSEEAFYPQTFGEFVQFYFENQPA